MISLIIPAYNERGSIGEVLKRAMALGLPGEVLVVDDGSTDGTYEIAKGFPVKVIRHETNKGYGASIKTGIRNASYEIIATCDADGEYAVEDIPKLISYINEYDTVIGARPFQKIPLIRKPAKWALRRLANYLVEINIPDLNSGVRIIRKDVALRFFHLLPSGFSLSTTLTLAPLSSDCSVKFIPISYNKRVGRSKIRPIRDTFNFFILILRIVMFFNPLKIFLPVSLFLFFVGSIILMVDIIFFRDVGGSSVITLNTAILVLMLGLLADLINKRSLS